MHGRGGAHAAVSGHRRPLAPPALDGVEFVADLGSGGHAEVFPYRQHLPDREVAVKVLIDAAASGAAFTAEANLMAKVSTHPYIVGVVGAHVADDGHPYLVMEYYPGANFLERAGTERFAIADALRVGVQVGGALETAHRAGILHRDVKPANILTSQYGRPGLTDFGIASAYGRSSDVDGISVPWSPPESFGAEVFDARADLYSLAATIYHLLAGRSPFAIPGGTNTLDLMSRIERERVPPIGRSDVPAGLERLLAQSMSKRPELRPSSVAELCWALQSIESELRLTPTVLELPDVGPRPKALPDERDDGATRVRGITEVLAQRQTVVVDSIPDVGSLEGVRREVRPPRERQGLLSEPDVEDTVIRAEPVAGGEAASSSSPTSRAPWFVGVAGAVVLLSVGGLLLMSGGGGGEASATTLFRAEALDELSAVASVDDITGTVTADGVEFSWSAPTGEAGDVYLFTHTVSGRSTSGRTEQHSVSFSNAVAGEEMCLAVVATRTGSADSGRRQACVTP